MKRNGLLAARVILDWEDLFRTLLLKYLAVEKMKAVIFMVQI